MFIFRTLCVCHKSWIGNFVFGGLNVRSIFYIIRSSKTYTFFLKIGEEMMQKWSLRSVTRSVWVRFSWERNEEDNEQSQKFEGKTEKVLKTVFETQNTRFSRLKQVARVSQQNIQRQNCEKCVFCVSKTVFKTFSVFPSNFCDYSLSSPFLSQLKLTQTLLKLHFCIISSQDLQEKVMGFLCLTWFFIFQVLFSWFLSCHCVLRYIEAYCVRNFFSLFRLMGLGCLFLLLISFANHNLFSLC